jgi:hypothetical protein
MNGHVVLPMLAHASNWEPHFFFARRTPDLLIRTKSSSTIHREHRNYRPVPEDPTHHRRRRGTETRRSAAAAELHTSQHRLDEEQPIRGREVAILSLPTRTAERRRAGTPLEADRREDHHRRSRRSRTRPWRPGIYTPCTPGTNLAPPPEKAAAQEMHHRSLATPPQTASKRGSCIARTGRRRPPHLTGAARKPHIYTSERLSRDSPPSRRRSGRRRERNPADTPAAFGRNRVASDSPLSTVERRGFQKYGRVIWQTGLY